MVTWQLLTGHDIDGPANGWPRCVVLHMFGVSVPICVRCCVLYPVTVATLAALIIGQVPLLPNWLLWTLPVPAWIEAISDWRSGVDERGRPLLRAIVTVPLGIGLGQLFLREFANPGDPLFWAEIVAFGGSATLIAVAAGIDKQIER